MRYICCKWPLTGLAADIPCAALQARTGCSARYLGASAANCNNQVVGLYSKTDGSALTLWQLTSVA